MGKKAGVVEGAATDTALLSTTPEPGPCQSSLPGSHAPPRRGRPPCISDQQPILHRKQSRPPLWIFTLSPPGTPGTMLAPFPPASCQCPLNQHRASIQQGILVLMDLCLHFDPAFSVCTRVHMLVYMCACGGQISTSCPSA